MINIKPVQTAAIKEWALACYPEEMCGYLTEDSFVPCENIADNKEKSFKISEAVLLEAMESSVLTAIVHSHPRNPSRPEALDTRTPSLADIKGQRDSGIPWLIVSTEGEVVTPAIQLPRDKTLPYIGRPFMWFISDCYTLVQDYYHRELGVELKDHKDVDFKSLRRHDGIFDSYVTEYGFDEINSISDLRNGDLLLLDNAGSKRNHLGIFHEGNVIHQDQVSVSQPFSTFIGRINTVLRYAS